MTGLVQLLGTEPVEKTPLLFDAKTCPSCGDNAIDAGAAFCSKCGFPLTKEGIEELKNLDQRIEILQREIQEDKATVEKQGEQIAELSMQSAERKKKQEEVVDLQAEVIANQDELIAVLESLTAKLLDGSVSEEEKANMLKQLKSTERS